MGKGDKKSKRGKIIAGSYGKKRPRKSTSVDKIPVKVLDEDDKKTSKQKVREEVGYPTEKSENAELEKKEKAPAKAKAEKKADTKDTKDTKAKAVKPKAEKKEDKEEVAEKPSKTKKAED